MFQEKAALLSEDIRMLIDNIFENAAFVLDFSVLKTCLQSLTQILKKS